MEFNIIVSLQHIISTYKWDGCIREILCNFKWTGGEFDDSICIGTEKLGYIKLTAFIDTTINERVNYQDEIRV